MVSLLFHRKFESVVVSHIPVALAFLRVCKINLLNNKTCLVACDSPSAIHTTFVYNCECSYDNGERHK